MHRCRKESYKGENNKYLVEIGITLNIIINTKIITIGNYISNKV